LVDCYSFWTFSDIFAENYFPSMPFHGGFGLLNLEGIAKPSYRAFQLLHQLGTELLPVQGNHATVDAWAVRDINRVTLVLTNFALPRHPIRTEQVQLQLTNVAPPKHAYVERVDEQHAHPRARWEQMGKPKYLSATEVAELEAASVVDMEPHPFNYQTDQQTLQVELTLPPQAVAMLTVELTPPIP